MRNAATGTAAREALSTTNAVTMPPAVTSQPRLRRFRATATSKASTQNNARATMPCEPDSNANRVIASASKGNARKTDAPP